MHHGGGGGGMGHDSGGYNHSGGYGHSGATGHQSAGQSGGGGALGGILGTLAHALGLTHTTHMHHAAMHNQHGTDYAALQAERKDQSLLEKLINWTPTPATMFFLFFASLIGWLGVIATVRHNEQRAEAQPVAQAAPIAQAGQAAPTAQAAQPWAAPAAGQLASVAQAQNANRSNARLFSAQSFGAGTAVAQYGSSTASYPSPSGVAVPSQYQNTYIQPSQPMPGTYLQPAQNYYGANQGVMAQQVLQPQGTASGQAPFARLRMIINR